jgi:hypothetical protein
METLRGFPYLPAMVRGRQAGQLPTRAPFRLAGARSRTPAALANAAAESTPSLPHAELDLGVILTQANWS